MNALFDHKTEICFYVQYNAVTPSFKGQKNIKLKTILEVMQFFQTYIYMYLSIKLKIERSFNV